LRTSPRAGSHVTILHNGAQPVRGFDRDIVEQILTATRVAGIEVHLNTPVSSVEANVDEIVAYTVNGGKERVFRAASGVLAAGRTPNIDGLALEAGDVDYTTRGVKVNAFLQSVSNPHVYAAGDVADAGGLPLTPVAGYEGEIVAANMLQDARRSPNFEGLVTMVYTIPSLGAVGLSESQARERGLELEVRAGDMNDWYSTRHVAQKLSAYKIVMQKGTGKLLGATILGPHAEEQINVLALAMRNGIDGSHIADTLFAYPTGSSDLEYLVG
jgi:glutathione reductase (NADPH)